MAALADTETADIMAAASSGIGDKGYQGAGFITPFKKPQGGELCPFMGLDATRRCAAVVELLAQVEHACGSCPMSPGLAASRVTWSRGCGL
jgi:hypothetical protein